MKWIFYTLAFMAALVLSGCNTMLVHPPSASAFMEKNNGAYVGNVSFIPGEKTRVGLEFRYGRFSRMVVKAF